jgi:hypothetical protein
MLVVTTPLTIENIACDTSAIESDGSRWHGRLTFTCGDLVATGTWSGDEHSEEGRLLDVEGTTEVFCERLDALTDQIEHAVSAAFGLPHEEDMTGIFGALEAVAKERAA